MDGSSASLLYVLTLCFTVLHLCIGRNSISNGTLLLSEGISFLEPTSYLISEPINTSSVLLRFTFQTSELNSLLLLSDPTGMELSARLLDGSVVIKDVEGTNHTLGRGFNNDRPHTLTIFHNSEIERFFFQLDNNAPVPNTYATDIMPVFGANGFYFGRPASAENLPPYFGCLKDIFYSDGTGVSDLTETISNSALQELSVTESVEGAFGDCRQCTDMDCGSGTCAVLWTPPITTFCDCRNSTFVGPSCSEDVVNTTREFPNSNGSYVCYTPSYSPYLYSTVSPSNTFSIQLLPPIPSEGTIATAFTSTGYFSLRIEGSQLVYRYSTTTLIQSNSMFRDITLTLEDRTMAYQIDVVVFPTSTKLNLISLSSGNHSCEPGIVLSAEQGVLYSTVCVGGTLLEKKNYNGTMRRAMFNQHSLFEEGKCGQLQQRYLDPSNYISATDVLMTTSSRTRPPMSFESVDFRSRLQFEIRKMQEGLTIFWIGGSEGASIFVSTVTGHVTVTIFIPPLTPIIGQSAATVADNEWHHFDFQATYTRLGNDSLRLFVDGQSITPFSGEFEGLNLTAFLGAPINLLSGGNRVGMPFVGCIRSVMFETPDSEVFCPNVEFMALLDELNYAVNESCFSCSRPTCPTSQTCFNPGYNLDSVCMDSSLPSSMTCSSSQLPLTTLPSPTPPTSIMPSDTTPPSTNPSLSSSEDPSTDTPQSTSQISLMPTGAGGLTVSAAAGIGVGVAILLAVIAAGVLIIIWILIRSRGRGFYRTNENSDREVAMGRFQASLNHNSVEAISPSHSLDEKPNGISRTNYSNGGPSHSNSIPSTSKEKEYYL